MIRRKDGNPLHDQSTRPVVLGRLRHARRLGINISAAARDGVAAAVRSASVQSDRAVYERQPEQVDTFWNEAEAWAEV